MALPEKDTTNWIAQYKALAKAINNFKGTESYIVTMIQKVSELPTNFDCRVSDLRDVSTLLTKITFNIL